VGFWWVPIGLAAWSGVAIVIALCIGPVLQRCSLVRDAIDQRRAVVPDDQESPRDEPQVQGLAVVRPRDPYTSMQEPAPSPRR
jgi:hypothetical protein